MKPAANGELHWHEKHVLTTNPSAGRMVAIKLPDGTEERRYAEGSFDGWIEHYRTLAPDLAKAGVGVEVVNASRETALDMFPRVKLEEVL